MTATYARFGMATAEYEGEENKNRNLFLVVEYGISVRER